MPAKQILRKCETQGHPQNLDIIINDEGKYKVRGTKKWLEGVVMPNGYCTLYIPKCKKTGSGGVTKWLHRAVWEAFNGPIPEKHEIDHVDKNPKNNKLNNLRCVSISENRKNRNLEFMAGMREAKNNEPKAIKGTCLKTGEEHVFKNQTACARHYGCSPALVRNICNGIGKTFGGETKFCYTDEEPNIDVPRKERPKKYNTEEERKEAKKEYYKKYMEKKKKEAVKTE